MRGVRRTRQFPNSALTRKASRIRRTDRHTEQARHAMQLSKGTPSFDFMKYRHAALVASGLLAAISLVSLVVRGLSLGVDFTGGVLVEAQYEQPADLGAIRDALAAAGFETAQVQNLGSASEVVIRLPAGADSDDPAVLRDRVLALLRAENPDVDLRQFDTVGPQVGEDLTEQSGVAAIIAFIMIFLYVMLRFRWKLALGAIIAELHDVLITVGLFSVVGWQFDLTVLGAVLAVLGYSLNDKIVIYDRIRENFRRMRRGTPEAIVNASINQVLSRTLVTGVSVLLVLVALLVLGGETLFGFSVALIFGVLVGTYSSIYVASGAALMLKITPADMVASKQRPDDGLP
jgi:preprotein translocase subunit SecF